MKKQLGGKSSLIYNKERTKAKLVKAVGQILVKQGFQNIRINNIEKVSGVSKKAIYDYFGGLDGLIKEYLDQVDYWKTLKLPNDNPHLAQLGLIDEEFMFNLLKNDFEYFFKSKEMQKIVLWGISEKNKTIRKLTDDREQLGEQIFENTDHIFEDTTIDFRAVMAIFVASIYYMGLHTSTNGSTLCGIDLSKEDGKNRILNAMNSLLKLTYSKSDISK